MESLAVVFLLLLGSGADPDTRFQEAYLAEVVDGRVADAAREYFALLSEPATPEALRREARFRFAVCCVLLGRADEARARLAEILADPAAPRAMKARVTAYRKELEGIGPGRELDRRLKGLLFELGRTRTSEGLPPVYRDFQILGKAAVPFLQGLLAHPDPALREHASRILCRMGVPGMIERLDLSRRHGRPFYADVKAYLEGREEEREALLNLLLALDDRMLVWQIRLLDESGFVLPASFAPRVAAREGGAHAALRILRRAGFGEPEWSLLVRWIREGDETLAREAAKQLTALVGREGWRRFAPPELFPVVVRRLTGAELAWRERPSNVGASWNVPHRRAGLEEFGRTVPREMLETVLRELVEKGEGWKQGVSSVFNPLRSGLADAVASALDAAGSDADPRPYRDLLLRWVAAGGLPPEPRHFSGLLERLPEREAEALGVRLFTEGPGKALGPEWLALLPVKSARGAKVLLAVLDAVGPPERARLLLATVFHLLPASAEVAEVMVPAFPHLARMIPGRAEWEKLALVFQGLSPLLPAGRAVAPLLGLLRAAGARSPVILTRIVGKLFAHVSGPPGPYWRRVAIPALPGAHELLSGEDRRVVVASAHWFLGQDGVDLGDARKPLAAFLLEHVTEVERARGLAELARRPDLFPLEAWVGRVSPDAFSPALVARIGREAADRAARKLAGSPAKLTAGAIAFLGRCPSPETRREIAEGLLTSGDPARIEKGVQLVEITQSAAPRALDAALRRLLADESPDLSTVSRLAVILVPHPTEALFPAVRKLLASPEPARVREGAEFARRLGREDFLPDLARLLDSLDEGLRAAARRAMDAILELRRLREEVRRRVGEGR